MRGPSEPPPRRAYPRTREPSAADRNAPKVMVITMFDGEAKPWLEGRKLDTIVRSPASPRAFPDVRCDAAGLCL